MTTVPQIRLLPKLGQRFRAGSPWLFSNEVQMTRLAKSIPAGSIVHISDDNNSDLGTAYFNPNSLICARKLSDHKSVEIGVEFFRKRLNAALTLRSRFFDTPYYRLVHAEGDFLPGLIIDRFDSVYVVQSGTAGMDQLLPHCIQALQEFPNCQTIVVKSDSPQRSYEGLEPDCRIIHGELGNSVTVTEGGISHKLDILQGQKTGWYFDQRHNREFLARHCNEARVLDAFCYLGAFGLSAIKQGAQSVTFIDSSDRALTAIRQTAESHGIESCVETIRDDAPDALENLAASKARFNVVSCDPPPFVKAKKDLEAGARAYRKLARLTASVVSSGGLLSLSSCSHAISHERFQQECAAGITRTGRHARLIHSASAGIDHPVHPHLPETAYLKALLYLLD